MIFESFPEKRDILHFLPPTAPLFGHFFLGFSMALGNSWHYVWPLHGGEVSSAALNNIHSQWQIFMSPSKKKLLKNILSSFTKVTLHWIHSFEKEGECIQRNVLSPNLSKLVGYQALWQIEFRRADFVLLPKRKDLLSIRNQIVTRWIEFPHSCQV